MDQVDTLRDLGERRLIDKFVIPRLREANVAMPLDDCAVIPIEQKTDLAVTIDAGPSTSFLQLLGVGSWRDLGHYYATMSLSDLAAAGARPLAILGACLLPGGFATSAFGQLLDGLALACQEAGARYVGGDTKESEKVRVITSGIGMGTNGRLLRRSGAKEGDLLLHTGVLGRALRHYILARHRDSSFGQDVGYRPTARVEIGTKLAEWGLATACVDASDGLFAAVKAIAEASSMRIHLDLRAARIADNLPGSSGRHRWLQLAMNVGCDYELVFTANTSALEKLRELDVVVCGQVGERCDTGDVELMDNADQITSAPWESFSTADRVVDEILALAGAKT